MYSNSNSQKIWEREREKPHRMKKWLVVAAWCRKLVWPHLLQSDAAWCVLTSFSQLHEGTCHHRKVLTMIGASSLSDRIHPYKSKMCTDKFPNHSTKTTIYMFTWAVGKFWEHDPYKMLEYPWQQKVVFSYCLVRWASKSQAPLC